MMHEWDSIIFIMVLTKHLEGVTWPGVKHSFAYMKSRSSAKFSLILVTKTV